MEESTILQMLRLLDDSYRHWTGTCLVHSSEITENYYRWLHEDAPFGLLSHDGGADPVFTYANLTAQKAFGYTMQEFLRLPSRLSAAPADREDRERVLTEVRNEGISHGYAGVRVNKSGERFDIHDGILWNLVDAQGQTCGQAALVWTNAPAISPSN